MNHVAIGRLAIIITFGRRASFGSVGYDRPRYRTVRRAQLESVFPHHSTGDSRAPYGCGCRYPPYSDWVRGNAAPVTWPQSVTHLDRQLDNDRTRRPPAVSNPSSISQTGPEVSNNYSDPYGLPAIRDRGLQVTAPRKLVQDRGCQVDRPMMADQSVCPDLAHLAVAPAPYRPVQSFRPPRAIRRFDVFGRARSIRGTRRFAPTPPEIDAPDGQSSPEITHEVDAPPRFYPIPSRLLPMIDAPPLFRPPYPPRPFGEVPPPPKTDPHFIPVPAGIHAVYPTAAVSIRSQPKLNRPVRRTPSVRRPGNQAPRTLSPNALMRRLAVILATRPEINTIDWHKFIH